MKKNKILNQLKSIISDDRLLKQYLLKSRGKTVNQRHENQNCVAELTAEIYKIYNCQKEVNAIVGFRGDMTETLRFANKTVDRWNPGWAIYSLGSEGRIAVSKGECSRSVVPGEYVSNKPAGLMPEVGDIVHIRAHAESCQNNSHWYFAFGECLEDQSDRLDHVRFYFHLRSEGASKWMAEITSIFNKYNIPFIFKALNESSAYCRADSAVLYLTKRHFIIGKFLILEVIEKIGRYLRASTPLFTFEISPGVGFAEDTGTEESFGMFLCRLVAESLFCSWQNGVFGADDLLAAIVKRFQTEGIDLQHPYLRPGSSADYLSNDFEGGIRL